ncbi:hypothetical protein tpqmel_0431 [Candidatus Gastranaerophilus sp. (ex Termes propinquus)]|nr:hypothetical protein tpqmel_0431 [Candidatus Gastranaerophilus sp. (ex Termes propinquus)]
MNNEINSIQGGRPLQPNKITKKIDTSINNVPQATSESKKIDLGDGVYGRAAVSFGSGALPKTTLGEVRKDVEYFQKNPELVSFCGEIFDHCVTKMPYEKALNTSYLYANAFSPRDKS